MRQVRIRRSSRLEAHPGDLATFSSWSKFTPSLAKDLSVLVEAGNAIFGPGTHWVEERVLGHGSIWPDLDIWQRISASLRDWVNGDIEAHAKHFAPEAIVVTPDGAIHRGLNEVSQAFAHEHQRLPNKQMRVHTFDITYPLDRGAIVAMSGDVTYQPNAQPEGWYTTQTLISREGVWLIAAHQIFHQAAGAAPAKSAGDAMR